MAEDSRVLPTQCGWGRGEVSLIGDTLLKRGGPRGGRGGDGGGLEVVRGERGEGEGRKPEKLTEYDWAAVWFVMKPFRGHPEMLTSGFFTSALEHHIRYHRKVSLE